MIGKEARSLRDLFSEVDCKNISFFPHLLGMQHPATNLLFGEPNGSKKLLYDDAVRMASANGYGLWAQQLSLRIKSPSFDKAASALAELRAFGAMREAGIDVKPVPRSRARSVDLEITLANERVLVEVASKLQDDAQAEMFREVEQGLMPAGVLKFKKDLTGWRSEVTIVPIEPGGVTRANLISRLCGIKQRELQIDGDFPSILWIDFRHFGPTPEWSLRPDDTSPLLSDADRLTSGALWHAFYGWKGAPIFHAHHRGLSIAIVDKQQHTGRFAAGSNSKFSAALLALSQDLILFENPYADHPLPNEIRSGLVRMVYFNLSRSICGWRPGDVGRAIEYSRSQLETVASYYQVEGESELPACDDE